MILSFQFITPVGSIVEEGTGILFTTRYSAFWPLFQIERDSVSGLGRSAISPLGLDGRRAALASVRYFELINSKFLWKGSTEGKSNTSLFIKHVQVVSKASVGARSFIFTSLLAQKSRAPLPWLISGEMGAAKSCPLYWQFWEQADRRETYRVLTINFTVLVN